MSQASQPKVGWLITARCESQDHIRMTDRCYYEGKITSGLRRLAILLCLDGGLAVPSITAEESTEILHLPPQGMVRARATGLSRLLTDPDVKYIISTDNDLEFPDPGWGERMLELIQKQPECGLMAPLTHRTGNPMQLILEEDYFWCRTEGVRVVPKAVPGSHWCFLPGFFWLLPRRTLEVVGNLDTSFAGCEDLDYSIRCHLAGLKLMVAQNVFVKHLGHQTVLAGSSQREHLERAGRARLYQKWIAGIGGVPPLEQIPPVISIPELPEGIQELRAVGRT